MDLKDVDIFFNYHTHTYRCGHAAKASDEEYVKEAIKAGIKVLGFSDHNPYKEKLIANQETTRMKYEQIADYFNSLDALNEKYKGTIEILKGFECEYYPNHLETIKELRGISDYLILGEHLNTLDNENKHSFTSSCSEDEARLYTDLVCEGLDSGLYDYLAHPDYFYGGTKDINDTFIECSHRICKKCEETNTPMEINFNGNSFYVGETDYKQGRHYHYPNRIFWEIASKYDVRCIIGFDAHNPKLFSEKEKCINDFSKEVDGLGLIIITEPIFRRKD